jgi:hypothetical protein
MEIVLKSELDEQLLREILALVGAHREPRSRRGKGLERGHAPGKGLLSAAMFAS